MGNSPVREVKECAEDGPRWDHVQDQQEKDEEQVQQMIQHKYQAQHQQHKTFSLGIFMFHPSLLCIQRHEQCFPLLSMHYDRHCSII